ncbi:MAG TPA: flagellar hook-length control protein FliK [Phycisphaerales bacterium]|nr:flagellar hook-length control protein FliK [Phycisphaerales bacterium]
MKPLPAAPAPVLQLGNPLGLSPMTAHSKAQKLRTHAQSKRDAADPAAFKEKLRDHRNGRHEATERAEDPEGGQRAGPSRSAQQPRTPEQPAVASDTAATGHEPEANEPGDVAADIAQPAADQNDLPSAEEIVAQVLEGVDPALRMKPAALARATTTVAGNAASSMRSARTAPSTPSVDTHGSPTGTETTDESGSAQQGTEGVALPTDFIAASAPEHAMDPRQTAADNAAQPDVSAPVKSTAPNGDQANAMGSPAAAPVATRSDEPRPTLTPALVAAPAVQARAAAGAKPAAAAAQQKTVAEQVQHGLDVAMHELPAPAGERLVTLKLHPSTLGSIRISMQVSGDRVNVRFQVGSAKAKGAIGKAMDDLQASITRQGLRVESLEVEEDSALAAPEGPQGGPQAHAPTGKGFATHPSAPPEPPVGPGADDGTGRTPEFSLDAEFEGGVLQVLTFRLDAVG